MKLRYKWLDLYAAGTTTNNSGNGDGVSGVVETTLTKDKMLEEINLYGGANNLPIIIINGHYVGGIQEL